MNRKSEIILMSLIALSYVGIVVSWVALAQPALQDPEETTEIMIQFYSIDRLIKNPCEPGTEVRMGDYIRCDRRSDYVPRKPRYWPGPYHERPKK